MLTRRAALSAALAMPALPALQAHGLAGQPFLDVELVLAADVSGSMGAAEANLQRRAYAEALASPEVAAAVARCAGGVIGLAYLEWSGEQKILLPMRAVAPADLPRIGQYLLTSPLGSAAYTAIGAALIAADELFTGTALRNVIDVSGDGVNSFGPQPRDVKLLHNPTVNALPILSAEEPGLLEWYRANVSGPRHGWCLPFVRGGAMAERLALKITSEIAGIRPYESLA